MLLSILKGDRETVNLIVSIRWGAGRKHQDITAQESRVAGMLKQHEKELLVGEIKAVLTK